MDLSLQYIILSRFHFNFIFLHHRLGKHHASFALLLCKLQTEQRKLVNNKLNAPLNIHLASVVHDCRQFHVFTVQAMPAVVHSRHKLDQQTLKSQRQMSQTPWVWSYTAAQRLERLALHRLLQPFRVVKLSRRLLRFFCRGILSVINNSEQVEEMLPQIAAPSTVQLLCVCVRGCKRVSKWCQRGFRLRRRTGVCLCVCVC